MSDVEKTIHPVRIFLSTPDDLVEERNVIKTVIDEFNSSNGFQDRFQLVLFSRHDRTKVSSPHLQIPPDHYLLRPDSADILICAIWLEMGNPHKTFLNPETGKPYQSLTEYEFFSAYRTYHDNGKPYPLIYRCVRPAPDMKTLDVTQYGRVQRFFERFEQDANLKDRIGEFAEADELKALVAQNLQAVLQELDIILPPTEEPVYLLPQHLPDGYVEPDDSLGLLRTALLGDHERIGITASDQGKTLLVQAICEDPIVRSVFCDGILWATLGPSPEILRHQKAWIEALGGQPCYSLEEAKTELRRLLKDRAMLLVLDDVRSAPDAELLQAGGPRCRTITTFREKEQLTGTIQMALGKLSPQESSELLIEAAQGNLNDTGLAYQIVDAVGQMPVTLQLAGALLAAGMSWKTITTAVERAKHDFADHPQDQTLALIKIDVEELLEAERSRYYELSIFPEREPLTEAVVGNLWGQTGGMKSLQVYRLLDKFHKRALIQADHTLSDLHREYLKQAVSDQDRQGWHGQFAETFNGIETRTEIDETTEYGWRRLGYHLAEAKQIETLRELLSSYSYLQHKIEYTCSEMLLRDFAPLPANDPLHRVADAIRLGAHVLDREPHELINQLYGRLGYTPDLHHEPVETATRLRLTSATLTPPGWPLIRTLEGHTFWVHGCALSSDGQTALSASADHTLRVWDVNTGKTLRLLRGHVHWVTSCVFSADGQLALSASADHTLQLWEVKTAKTLRTFQGHEDKVNGCALSADGQIALSASTDQTLHVWSVNRAKTLRVLEGHVGEVTGCALSPDGQRAVSSSVDGTLRLWDVNTGEVLHVLEGHENSVTSCAFSQDGRRVLSGSGDNTLRLWDASTGDPQALLEGHRHWVLGCALSHDGHLAMSVSIDGTVRLWDAPRGRTLRLMQGPGSALTSCALSTDGRLAISASADNTLQLWDASGWQILDSGQWQVKPIGASVYSPDGRLAVSASIDNMLWLWDASSGHIRHTLRGHSDIVTGCIFSPDGCRVLSASADHTLRLWDADTGQALHTLQGHTDTVTHCALNREGSLALSASADCTLRLWNLSTGSELTRWTADSPLYSCAFSPDGQHVIAGELSGNMHFLRMENL